MSKALSSTEFSLDVREQTLLTRQEIDVLCFLQPISIDYPNFTSWYVSKVIPGIRRRERLLVCTYLNGELSGVGIGKSDELENKICTIRVAPSYQGRGIGVRLFDKVMDWLPTSMPHLTVSESQYINYSRIFDRYGFRQTSSHLGLYIQGQRELFFNE